MLPETVQSYFILFHFQKPQLSYHMEELEEIHVGIQGVFHPL